MRGRRALVESSVAALGELGLMLRGVLAERAESPPETLREARELVSLVEAHAKAVQAIIKVERELDEERRAGVRPDVTIEGTAFELDLDGARGELLAELGRLQAEVEGGS
jgi:hypothetical protein